MVSGGLVDCPHVLCGVAELTARNAGTEIEVADSDAVILQVISKVIIAFGHRSDKDCYALVLVQSRDVVADTHNL